MRSIPLRFIRRIKAFFTIFGAHGRTNSNDCTISVICNNDELPKIMRNKIPPTFIAFKIKMTFPTYHRTYILILNKKNPYPVVYLFDSKNKTIDYMNGIYHQSTDKISGHRFREGPWGTQEQVQQLRELMESDEKQYGHECDEHFSNYITELHPPRTIQQALALEKELKQQNRGAYYDFLDPRAGWILSDEIKQFLRKRAEDEPLHPITSSLRKRAEDEPLHPITSSLHSVGSIISNLEEKITSLEDEMRQLKHAYRLEKRKKELVFRIDQDGQFIP